MLKVFLRKVALGSMAVAVVVTTMQACAELGGTPAGLGAGGASGRGATGGSAGGGSGGSTTGGTNGGGGGSAAPGTGGSTTTASGGTAPASGGVAGRASGGSGSGGIVASGGTAAGSGGMSGGGGNGGSGAVTGSGGGSVTNGDLKGKKVLFVVDNPSSLSDGDTMLKDLMVVGKEMVVTLADTMTANANAATMNLIVASSGASASEFPALYKAVAVPIVVFGNAAYQAMGFIGGSSGKGSVSTPVMLTIVDGTTPLASSLATGTNFTAIGTTRSTSVYWGTPGGNPVKVAAVVGAAAELISFAYEKGATMATGTAPARRVGLGFKTDVFGDLSVESYKLMNAALEWTAGASP